MERTLERYRGGRALREDRTQVRTAPAVSAARRGWGARRSGARGGGQRAIHAAAGGNARRTTAWSGSNQSPAVSSDTGYGRRPPRAVVGHRDRWLQTQASEPISYGLKDLHGRRDIALPPHAAQRRAVSRAAGRRRGEAGRRKETAVSKGRGAAGETRRDVVGDELVSRGERWRSCC